jgi:hypothetical protein
VAAITRLLSGLVEAVGFEAEIAFLPRSQQPAVVALKDITQHRRHNLVARAVVLLETQTRLVVLALSAKDLSAVPYSLTVLVVTETVVVAVPEALATGFLPVRVLPRPSSRVRLSCILTGAVASVTVLGIWERKPLLITVLVTMAVAIEPATPVWFHLRWEPEGLQALAAA